jgi:hypothetical protein
MAIARNSDNDIDPAEKHIHGQRAVEECGVFFP